MDGYPVMPMTKAAAQGDVFVTVTGNTSVMSSDHFGRLKDGAILCNSGTSTSRSTSRRSARWPAAGAACGRSSRSTLDSGRRSYVLGEGRLINLAAAEGIPPP